MIVNKWQIIIGKMCSQVEQTLNLLIRFDLNSGLYRWRAPKTYYLLLTLALSLTHASCV